MLYNILKNDALEMGFMTKNAHAHSALSFGDF
jgi:hypothetical protein